VHYLTGGGCPPLTGDTAAAFLTFIAGDIDWWRGNFGSKHFLNLEAIWHAASSIHCVLQTEENARL